MILSLLSILSLLTLITIIMRYDWGLCFIIAFFFLVPLSFFYIFGFHLGTNVVYLFLLLLSFSRIHDYKIKECNYIMPFLFYFLFQDILIIFHPTSTPIEYQLNAARVDLMGLIPAFAIYSYSPCTVNFRKKIQTTIRIVIAITTLYGLYLLSMPGSNPYAEIVTGLVGKEVLNQENILDEGLRIFGYITSVYKTATEYGIFLIFAAIYCFYDVLVSSKKLIPVILLSLVLVNIFVCGARSALYTLFALIILYLLFHKKIKAVLISIIAFVLIYYVIINILPEYLAFVFSVTDQSVNGSTTDMRIEQWMGGLNTALENPLGMGYGWTGWYRNTIGRHPVMLSFESIFIQTFCNNGFLAIPLWTGFVIYYKRVIQKTSFNNEIRSTFLLLLFAGYLIYSLMTGDYGDIRPWSIFLVLILIHPSSSIVNDRVTYKKKVSII